jgi:pyrroline-5-carboxylate reductase
MRIGFVGTGTIAAAIIRGIAKTGWEQPITVSPRGAKLATALADEIPNVAIAQSNQGVVDASDWVFLSIRPQVADDVVRDLHFADHHMIVSLIATKSISKIGSLIGGGAKIHRAVPLPFVEHGLGGTPIHPPDVVLESFFNRLGRAIVVQDESDLDLLLAASATMGGHFTLAAALSDWLEGQGVAAKDARSYVLQLMVGLADSAKRGQVPDFHDLAVEFSTRGGLNEQFRTHLKSSGVTSSYQAGLDAVLHRVTGT